MLIWDDPLLYTTFLGIYLKPFKKIKQKVAFGKKSDLKSNHISETDKTLNRNCLKEFLMHMLKVSVVMNKARTFKDFLLKGFLCWNITKKPLIWEKTN
jgi:hypothetical protein